MNMPPSHEKAFQAVAAGDIHSLITLIEHDPPVRNAVNTDGISLLSFAVYNGKKEIADMLVGVGARIDIFSASAHGALNEIVALVRSEPDLVGAYSPDGWTPLHLASFFGHLLVVEYLLMSRADINAVSRNGLKNQPLNAATASNKTDVAKFLVKHGADIHFAQHEGITPLHSSAFSGNEELVKLFLAHGADRHLKAENGKTPGDMAAERGHTKIAAMLQSP